MLLVLGKSRGLQIFALVTLSLFIVSTSVYADMGFNFKLRPQAAAKSGVKDELSAITEVHKPLKPIKRIGILTGGGPASGHNAAIYAVLREAQYEGIEVIGIQEGYRGLINDSIVAKARPLTLKEAEKERFKGGTMLFTQRDNPYDKEAVEKGLKLNEKVWANIQKLNLDALIVLGGDDTQSAAYKLQMEHPEFPFIGLSKTMDNDLNFPEPDAVSYGFVTYVDEATGRLENGKQDAISTKRVLVTEIFGRKVGHVAVHAGANVEATRTLIPEEGNVDLDKLIKDVSEFYKKNQYGVVVVSEGISIKRNLGNNAAILEKAFAKDPVAKVAFEKAEQAKDRDSYGNPKLEYSGIIIAAVLKAHGLTTSRSEITYLERSAPPSQQDFYMCDWIGETAVKDLLQGIKSCILYVHDGTVKSIPFAKNVGGRAFNMETHKDIYLKANQALLPAAANSAVTQNPASSDKPAFNFTDVTGVTNALKGIVDVTSEGVKIVDENAIRASLIDKLVYDATFNPNKEVVEICRKLILDIAKAQGATLGSVYNLYVQKAYDPRRWSIPAINVRGMAYNTARSIFASARDNKVGPFILEIAKSEIKYTGQRPAEFTTSMLAAAIKEGYKHPVYLQGDHFQIDADLYFGNAKKEIIANPQKAISDIKALIREAVLAGFYQIDLDMSPSVDYTKATVREQQENNYKLTAELTAYVRALEREFGLDKAGIVVNLGGEIGEIGKGLDKDKQQNSSIAELRAFMDNYLAELKRLSKEAGYELKGITKVAVQTGTKHGGVRDAQGQVTKAKVSFNTLAELGKVAREEYGLSGVVQHGASTLPQDYFSVFAGKPVPEGMSVDSSLLDDASKTILSNNPVGEVHLATAYQDTTLDNVAFPVELLAQIKAYIAQKFPAKEGEDPNKVFVDNRKNVWGPFKAQVWNMPAVSQDAIRVSLKNQFDTVFKNLGIIEVQDSYVQSLDAKVNSNFLGADFDNLLQAIKGDTKRAVVVSANVILKDAGTVETLQKIKEAKKGIKIAVFAESEAAVDKLKIIGVEAAADIISAKGLNDVLGTLAQEGITSEKIIVFHSDLDQAEFKGDKVKMVNVKISDSASGSINAMPLVIARGIASISQNEQPVLNMYNELLQNYSKKSDKFQISQEGLNQLSDLTSQISIAPLVKVNEREIITAQIAYEETLNKI